jgi:hypothetical protein
MKKTYKTGTELYRIAQKHYKDDNCCAVVALAITCQVSFGKAFNLAKRLGRVTGKGTPWNIIFASYEALGYKLVRVESYAKTVSSLSQHLPSTGRYLVHVRGHVLAFDGGTVKDWSEGRRHRIKDVYQVVKNN